jgi:hypothetical protein
MIDVWRTETSDKRAPGGISYTNTVFTPIGTVHCGATPQSTSLKRLAGFDLSLVTTTRRQVVDWFKKARFTSLPIATGSPEACLWFYIHIGRPCTYFTSVCTTLTFCAYSIRSCLCSSVGGGNWIPRISSHSGKKRNDTSKHVSNRHREARWCWCDNKRLGAAFMVLFI